MATLVLVAASLSLASPVLSPSASPAAVADAAVAAPWVTAAQPAGTSWSVEVLDAATLSSPVSLAVATLHVWGAPDGPTSLISESDGVYSADFAVSGLLPGHHVASVSWTPVAAGAATTWSSPVVFAVGGPPCSRPPVPVALPGIDVSYSTHTTKPWGVRYLPLDLTFAPTSPGSSSTCSLLATGTLNVQIGLRLVEGQPQFTIPVDSVATAELDVLRPDAAKAIPVCDWVTVKLDCALDDLDGTVLRWHTEGFSEQLQNSQGTWVQVFDSGPLTYYDSVDPTLSFSQQVQTAETAFHLDLIGHLQDINPLYVIQEPPAHLRVADGAGRVTGLLPGGRAVDDIPGSVTVADGSGYSAVVLLVPRGAYSVTAWGPAHSSYSLTMDELGGRGDRGSDLTEATAGRFATTGHLSVCLPAAGGRCPRVLRPLPVVAERPLGHVVAPPPSSDMSR